MLSSRIRLIEKYASAITPIVGRGAGIALGYLLPYVGNRYLVDASKSLSRQIRTKKDFPSLVQEVKNIAGMPKIPHTIIEGIDNATYIPSKRLDNNEKKIIKHLAKDYYKNGDKINGKLLMSIIDASDSPNGGLIIGNKMTNPYTVAHELGHAILENEGSVSGFLQRHASKANILGNTMIGVGLIPGAISLVGMLSGNKTPVADVIAKGLFYGGTASNVIGNVSRVIYENRANEIGRELLAQSDLKLTARQKELGEQMYGASLGTYAMSPLADILPVAGYELAKNLF